MMMTFNINFVKVFALLGYYAAYSSNFLPPIGTTHRSYIQSPEIKEIHFFLDFRHLKMYPLDFPKTSIMKSHYAVLNIKYYRISYLLRTGSLKSRTSIHFP